MLEASASYVFWETQCITKLHSVTRDDDDRHECAPPFTIQTPRREMRPLEMPPPVGYAHNSAIEPNK